ncbi:MAG: MFS transporter [Desulfobacterales bacterium]|nr:MFS transporter [Desulfobacterales bacterium]
MQLNLPTILKVFLPFAAGYFLSYLFRVVNAVIAPDLVADIGLNPSDLGLLTSAYFLTFAAFQLPLGVLLDRFGPRKTEAILLIFAGLGAFIFARAETVTGLLIGRAFIGFGVSACLMAAFTAFVIWFPARHLPLINGFQMAAGGLGAVAGTVPVQKAMEFTDWRGLFMGLAGFALVVAVTVLFVVPEKPREASGTRLRVQIQGIRRIFTSFTFWRIAPLTVMSQASALSIHGLWAGPWLKDVAGLDRQQIAFILFLTAVAMIAGFIILGVLAARLSDRDTKVFLVPVAGMASFMVIQTVLTVGNVLPPWLMWVLFGFFSTAGIVTYAELSRQFPASLAGRVNTALNLLVFVAAFAGQWGIGAIVNLWTPSAQGLFPAVAYRAGFGVMLALQVLGLAWVFLSGKFHRKEA